MSDTEEDSTSGGSTDDDSTDNSNSGSDDDEDENQSSFSDEEIEKIQVSDVRTAVSMATGGKNVVTIKKFNDVLETLNINLNEKRREEFFQMLDENEEDEVGWNRLFYVLRDGQSKFKGLPMDQMVGGLLYEFASSDRGRKKKQLQAKKSMISFMQSTTGSQINISLLTNDINEQNSLNIPLKSSDNVQAGLTKPTRHISEPTPMVSIDTIIEDSEADTFNISTSKKSVNGFSSSQPSRGRTRAGTVSAAPPKRFGLKSRTSQKDAVKIEKSKRESVDMSQIDAIRGSPMGNILSDNLKTQQESLNNLYSHVSEIEEMIRSKPGNESLINGMNNVLTLQNAINGIAKSSVQSLKNDMTDVLNKSAVHSAHQVAKEISSQLTRMNHSINSTNKILSAQSGSDFNEKLENLRDQLEDINMMNEHSMLLYGNMSALSAHSSERPSSSRPMTSRSSFFGGIGAGTGNPGKVRLNSAKSVKTSHSNNKSLVSFQFNAEELEQHAVNNAFGVNGLDKDDIQPIIEDMDNIKKSIGSLDDCLQKIVADRLLKLEKTVFALFGQIASNKKDTFQLMPVEELATQLDLQKANFEAQIQKSQLKVEELEKLLEHRTDIAHREKQSAQEERERLLIALGKFLQQKSVVNELRGELKKRLGMELKKEVTKDNGDDAADDDKKGDEETEDVEPEMQESKTENYDIVSAEKHIALNDYEPNSKYNEQNANYEKKLYEHNEKLQMKALKSILEYQSIDDLPTIANDEIPDFLQEVDDNSNEERMNDKECEELLGFGYEELLRVYRANTSLNINMSFAKWEREELMQQIKELKQPIIINTVGKSTEIALQLKLQSYVDQINEQKQELHKYKSNEKRMRLIDKYRLEMYRDLKKEENLSKRNLREEKLEILRQKRMIKKLFDVTKYKASKIMQEANNLRKSVKDEIAEYQEKRHEAVLMKAKYEDKMSKNKIEMQQQFINEEVAKHIEIYKEHIEDEANERAQREMEEELEHEKDHLSKQLNERIEDIQEDIEKERIAHEKEIKRLQRELKQESDGYTESLEDFKAFKKNNQQTRRENNNLKGQIKELTALLEQTKEEFANYKLEHAHDNDDDNQIVVSQKNNSSNQNGAMSYKLPSGPLDPEAIYCGFYSPSDELVVARREYKRMKMNSDQKTVQLKKILREKAELSEEVGRLNVEIKAQRELVQKRDAEILEQQQQFDNDTSSKLRPFVKLVEGIGRDVLHNAPTNYIFNYKKRDFAELEKDLERDRSDWYIHKNHILRCFFFSIEEWFRDQFWLHERIVQCNSSVHEAMQQVLKDSWMETRIQTHSFIRWFGDLDNEQEVKLFYSVQFNNEERYFWNVDIFECVDDYRQGVIDKYYKEVVAEREERREGYWKRHPDVYALFKQRHIETIKRYKKRMQEKKAHLEYMKKEKLEILDETDLTKIKQDFARIKQEKKRNSQIGLSSSQQHKPRLSQTNSSNHSGSKRSSKRMSSKNIHGSSKNIHGSSKNIHSNNQ